jgi:hypothetical protein
MRSSEINKILKKYKDIFDRASISKEKNRYNFISGDYK